MRPDTRNDDTPTARHWVIAFTALSALIFGVPALAELVTGLVLR